MRSTAICGAFAAALLLAAGTAAGERRPWSGGCDGTRDYTLASPVRAYYAVARHGLVAYRSPNGPALVSFGRLNVNGVPTVFGIVGVRVGGSCRPAWYHVQLPIRPNGITGYVRSEAVRIGRVGARVTVDLSAHELVAYRDGLPVLRSTVAVGSPATPTPTGSYYVNQRLLTTDVEGPFGFGGIGISAFSPVLTSWVQGGPIGIHGTNRPWSIGRSVSSGCIRVRNDVLRVLWRFVVEGTPVIITP